MGKHTTVLPFVTWRDGRPRYIPGPAHRKLGLKGEDLRHPDGSWFTLDQARAWAEERKQHVAALNATPARKRGQARAAAPGGWTVGVLFGRWFQEPRLNGQAVVEGRKSRLPLKPHTVRFYRNAANQLEALDDGKIWNASAAALTSNVLAGVLHKIEVKHGLATARAVRAAISAAYGWARSKSGIANPAQGLHETLPVPAPRIRVGTPDEMKALIAAADALDRPDVGDAIMLGLWTGQRQETRLNLTDGQISPDGIVFRQSKKHGQPLLIPASPELATRLKAARDRRRSWRVNYPHVVLDEVARAPFKPDWYRKLFRLVRDAAVKGDAETGRPECKSLADFRDQDLRDTAVTWLALAGCSKMEIAAITGHSLKSVDEILKHYLGMHPELARSAIAKLVSWFDHQQEGEGR